MVLRRFEEDKGVMRTITKNIDSTGIFGKEIDKLIKFT